MVRLGSAGWGLLFSSALGCDGAQRPGPVVCGDGLVQGAEWCDDGLSNGDGAACTNECMPARCGDGYVWSGEEACDDGNNADGDGCAGDCSVCGDGLTTGSESCDDGNVEPYDGCHRCRLPGEPFNSWPSGGARSVQASERLVLGHDIWQSGEWIRVLGLDGVQLAAATNTISGDVVGASGTIATSRTALFGARSVDVTSTYESEMDLTLASYEIDGRERWTVQFPKPEPRDSAYAFELAETADGGLAVGGFIMDLIYVRIGGGNDFRNYGVVARYDASGRLLWDARFQYAEQNTVISQIAEAFDGSVCAAGYIDPGSEGYFVTCFDSDGFQRWLTHVSARVHELWINGTELRVVSGASALSFSLSRGTPGSVVPLAIPSGDTISGVEYNSGTYLVRGGTREAPQLYLLSEAGPELWRATPPAPHVIVSADLGFDDLVYAVTADEQLLVFDPGPLF